MLIYYSFGEDFHGYRTVYASITVSEEPIERVVLDYWNMENEELKSSLSRLKKSIRIRKRLEKVNITLSGFLGFISIGFLTKNMESLGEFNIGWGIALALPVGLALAWFIKLLGKQTRKRLHYFPEGQDWFMAAILALGWMAYLPLILGFCIGWAVFKTIETTTDRFFLSIAFIDNEREDIKWKSEWV